jgi:hypothetical protein
VVNRIGEPCREALRHLAEGNISSRRALRRICTNLCAAELTGSMGRVAAAGDNAAMESFDALLQKNVLDRRRWRTRAELHYAIVFWIAHLQPPTTPASAGQVHPGRVRTRLHRQRSSSMISHNRCQPKLQQTQYTVRQAAYDLRKLGGKQPVVNPTGPAATRCPAKPRAPSPGCSPCADRSSPRSSPAAAIRTRTVAEDLHPH